MGFGKDPYNCSVVIARREAFATGEARKFEL